MKDAGSNSNVESDELKRFRSLSDLLPHIVWTSDPYGEIDYMNSRWSSYSDEVPENDKGLSKVVLENESAEIRKTWHRNIDLGVYFEMELRLRLRNGHFRWHLLRAVPVKDIGGSRPKWVGTTTDIEDQKRDALKNEILSSVRDAILESTRDEEIFKNIPEMIVPKFADMCMIFLVDESSYKLNSLASKSVEQKIALEQFWALNPEKVAEILKLKNISSANHKVNDSEMSDLGSTNLTDSDGTKILSIKSMMGEVLTVNKKIWGVISFISESEIYSKKDLELVKEISWRVSRALEKNILFQSLVDTRSKLQRSNRDLERFAYIASHDLQEPLRMVGSYVQLIERKYKGILDTDGKEFINFAVDGVKRMQQLIADLLNYSQVPTQVTEIEEINLNDVVAKARKSFESEIIQKNAVFSVENLPLVMGNSNQLVQIFENLISNSLKFTKDKKPEIKISAETGFQFHTITIKDNGVGFDNRYATKIFEVFKRLHGREKYPGSGIGLSIAKKIVESWNGKIWAEADIASGASVHFTVPVSLKV
jgi:PAS domain S-box-containing protein